MGYDPYANSDCHVPDGHNGDCIYCRGFSYTDPWWHERCDDRVEHEKGEIKRRPQRIREEIAALQEELAEAEAEAEKLQAK